MDRLVCLVPERHLTDTRLLEGPWLVPEQYPTGGGVRGLAQEVGGRHDICVSN